MAGPVAIKRFYYGLGALALVGAGIIWWAARGDDGVTVTTAMPPGSPVGAEVLPGYVVGSDSAPVEVIEYADFQCPACRVFTILTFPDVYERLIKTGRVKWRFRDRPLSGHDRAPLAHHAAACAGEQDRFWGMHDQLYHFQPDWSTGLGVARKFRNYARTVGLDIDRYEECMDSNRFQARIAATAQQATNDGVTSTPTLVVGGVRVSGSVAYDRLKAIIDSVAERSTS